MVWPCHVQARIMGDGFASAISHFLLSHARGRQTVTITLMVQYQVQYQVVSYLVSYVLVTSWFSYLVPLAGSCIPLLTFRVSVTSYQYNTTLYGKVHFNTVHRTVPGNCYCTNTW